MNTDKIKVLIAEDSPTARLFLSHLLESDPRLQVVGGVADGQGAVDFVQTHDVDVILMDLHMPHVDGFEATRRIMEGSRPLPIVICTAVSDSASMEITFRSLEAGALACVDKPVGREQKDFQITATRLIEMVRLMSEVKVVGRRSRSRPAPSYVPPSRLANGDLARVVGIGASTGGPPVLQMILSSLPKDFPAPIFIVQHIASGFLSGMMDWLNQTTPLQVQVASYGIVPMAGHVYLAPDDFHMGVNNTRRITLTREGAENGVRPSVSFLFRSLANVYGVNGVGVLLTGMGSDGAEELKTMKDRGAVTIAQDYDSSIVHGMPGKAIALGAATHVLPAEKIAETMLALVENRTVTR